MSRTPHGYATCLVDYRSLGRAHKIPYHVNLCIHMVDDEEDILPGYLPTLSQSYASSPVLFWKSLESRIPRCIV